MRKKILRIDSHNLVKKKPTEEELWTEENLTGDKTTSKQIKIYYSYRKDNGKCSEFKKFLHLLTSSSVQLY
jgi:hypothetical protein